MKIPPKIRSRKLGIRVDLTAMVSLSFLLIIFFMVTIELSKPKIMNLGLPDYGYISCYERSYCIDENRIMTLLLDDNNEVVSYTGIIESPIHPPKSFTYSKNGIGKEIFNKNQLVLEYSAQKGLQGRGMTVIIKPSKKCNFKNLVDILDEMAINKIQTYSVLNTFTPEEQKLLDEAKI